jgi:hypothetical protein
VNVTIDAIVLALAATRFDCTDEYRLQAGCADALATFGLIANREVRLSASDRIDLTVGTIGIECKVDGSPSDVARQCLRYLHSPKISGLVLVTGRASVARFLPRVLVVQGVEKPLRVVETWRSSL